MREKSICPLLAIEGKQQNSSWRPFDLFPILSSWNNWAKDVFDYNFVIYNLYAYKGICPCMVVTLCL